jgi:hypothetical protein
MRFVEPENSRKMSSGFDPNTNTASKS